MTTRQRNVFSRFTQVQTTNGLSTPSSRLPETFSWQNLPESGGSRDRRRPGSGLRFQPGVLLSVWRRHHGYGGVSGIGGGDCSQSNIVVLADSAACRVKIINQSIV